MVIFSPAVLWTDMITRTRSESESRLTVGGSREKQSATAGGASTNAGERSSISVAAGEGKGAGQTNSGTKEMDAAFSKLTQLCVLGHGRLLLAAPNGAALPNSVHTVEMYKGMSNLLLPISFTFLSFLI